MAKIKLIESLRSIKRTTIRYNGLKKSDYYLLAL